MKQTFFTPQQMNFRGHLLPQERFRPFADRIHGDFIQPDLKEHAIAAAEKLCNEQYPVLPFSEYLMFQRNGNRTIYETKYFKRRNDLTVFIVAEKAEGKGRFLDHILNLVWMILEESTWVIPAHMYNGLESRPPLDEPQDYEDLFSAMTGAHLAWAWYLFHEEFDKISPVINKRIYTTLEKRILNPLLQYPEQGWMGTDDAPPNNWCPWILSNILTVCSFISKEMSVRERIVELALLGLNRFASAYGADGACEEGPSYWGVSCGALYNACLVLYDLSGGYIDAFSNPLLKNMGEFLPNTYISNGRFINFSDCRSKLSVCAPWIYDWGQRVNSPLMMGFYSTLGAPQSIKDTRLDYINMPYRYYRQLGLKISSPSRFALPRTYYSESQCLAVTREYSAENQGFYLSVKGGHNGVSHNHNDVGNFTVFYNGAPVFIDAGVGTYTKRTFSANRYDIWSMASEYHNLPTINGFNQLAGPQYASCGENYDPETGGLSMNLTNAYPAEAGIKRYIRHAVLEEGNIRITDTITLNLDGNVVFNYLTTQMPATSSESSFTLGQCRVFYDPSLCFGYTIPDCTLEETATIPSDWDAEALYRICLSSSSLGKELTHSFVLTISPI